MNWWGLTSVKVDRYEVENQILHFQHPKLDSWIETGSIILLNYYNLISGLIHSSVNFELVDELIGFNLG